MRFFAELKRSPILVVVVAFTAVSMGLTYGYDTSNISGAMLFVGDEFNLSGPAIAALATVVVLGQILGALGGGWLADRIGRKPAMVAIALGYLIFALGAAASPHYVVLLVCRLLLGVTVGISIAVVPVFVAESSPDKVRGGLLVGYQVTTVLGIIVGYLVAWALASSGEWRWVLGLAAVPAAVVFVLLFRVPETGQWYLMHHQVARARAALLRLDPDRDVDADIAVIEAELGQESGRIKEMFTGPLLRATLFVIILGFFVQITGINATIYYAPEIFKQMGFTGYSATLGLPALVQFLSLIAVVISMMIIDSWGRRKVLLTGIGVMVASTAILALVFASSAGLHGAGTWIGFGSIVLFTMGYTFGFGSIIWVYAGESFPTKYRALGASLMLTADLIANAIVAQFFPSLLSSIGGSGVFAIFAVLSLLAFIFVFRWAPETKGRDLSQISAYWANGATWPEDNVEPKQLGH